MQTALYAILHMFVDGACALAMYGWFSEGKQGYVNILLYNFCAFALQMPLGTMLDLQMIKYDKGKSDNKGNAGCQGKEILIGLTARRPLLYAATGALLTIIGTVTHPLILGIGNALFHVGGGVDVIREDWARNWKGRALGVFVAPGALGLYIGSLAAKSGNIAVRGTGLILGGIVMIGLATILFLKEGESVGVVKAVAGVQVTDMAETMKSAQLGRMHSRSKTSAVLVCCLLVVILRSYVGMAVRFPWKTTVAMGLFSVMAVVLGKMTGGFLAATFGQRKVIIISLLMAAVSFLFYEQAGFGIMAQFFFNMTMPVTLYLLAKHFRKLPGFSFGLLTFGLFLGFLPAYFEKNLSLSGSVIGCVGSIVSLFILLAAVGRQGKYGHLSA